LNTHDKVLIRYPDFSNRPDLNIWL
jgi:hypothetical protein